VRALFVSYTTSMGANQNAVQASSARLDERYGVCREPSEIRPWEEGVKPRSLVMLTKEVGTSLRTYRDLAQGELFWNMSQCSTFIWAMDELGQVFLAFEEVIPDGDIDIDGLKEGHPRRRGFPAHPAQEKKLGHPTLLGGGQARVAGELLLDVAEEKLHWFVNCASGRYCRLMPPTHDQCRAIHELFMECIDDGVRFDNPLSTDQ